MEWLLRERLLASDDSAWDADCQSVLSKFPPALKSRIENILVSKEEPLPQAQQSAKDLIAERIKGKISARKPSQGARTIRPKVETAADQEVAPRAAAVQMSPRSKQEHVSR
jgi:hypothetical protein